MSGGTGAFNVIPYSVTFNGTVRTYSEDIRNKIEKRTFEIADGITSGFDAKLDFVYQRMTDSTINDTEHAMFCADIAEGIFGGHSVNRNAPPSMGGEDFGAMLKVCPGAYIKLGQGVPEDKNSPCNHGLHNPQYDFNDELIPLGVEYWVKLVEESFTSEIMPCLFASSSGFSR